jgi:hypothetical protein
MNDSKVSEIGEREILLADGIFARGTVDEFITNRDTGCGSIFLEFMERILIAPVSLICSRILRRSANDSKDLSLLCCGRSYWRKENEG